jgi:hypothetical protein
VDRQHPARFEPSATYDESMTISRRALPVALVLVGVLSAPVGAGAHVQNTWKPADVIAALKKAGLPIAASRVYTESNDPNKLMGRPGQYVGKATFHDRRIKDAALSVSNGGSIETFASKSDASVRFKYICAIAKSSPLFAEYDYLEGSVLLRIASDLTPTQAKGYETAFRRIV